MKTVLIDDESRALEALELLLKEYCPQIKLIGKSTSAEKGLQLIQDLQPELVFLDIQMPHMNGIELLESFGSDRYFEVIFITAFDQFAIKAFRLSAADYLLKPINIEELQSSVGRVLKRKGRAPDLGRKIIDLREAFLGRIALPTRHGSEFVEVSDILRIEADGSYSQIYFTSGKRQIISRNLKELQMALHGLFFLRVHKSHLVNLKHIIEYTALKNGGILKMRDGSLVDIARTHKSKLQDLMARKTTSQGP